MWRAFLADGTVVDHDGDNTPQEFLASIVRFQVFSPKGSPLADIHPAPGERIVWRWTRENADGAARTVGVKFGVVNADGEVNVKYLDAATGEWSPTDDVRLTPAEVA